MSDLAPLVEGFSSVVGLKKENDALSRENDALTRENFALRRRVSGQNRQLSDQNLRRNDQDRQLSDILGLTTITGTNGSPVYARAQLYTVFPPIAAFSHVAGRWRRSTTTSQYFSVSFLAHFAS